MSINDSVYGVGTYRDGNFSPCSLSAFSLEGTPAGSFENPIVGPPELFNPGAKSGRKINVSPPMTPTTDGDSQTSCGWEKKRVLQVNYFINGVGEENFIPAEILGNDTGLMRKIGYRTLRVKTHVKQRGMTSLANQVMAGYLRGQSMDSKGMYTCSALMCFENDSTLEVMSCEARFCIDRLESVEVLPVLHLRERQKYKSLQDLAEQMITDLKCAQYLPNLARTQPQWGRKPQLDAQEWADKLASPFNAHQHAQKLVPFA
eukprot:CAMPEP_0114496484 /NCGR_PEP_ID=MMETSP0109-20121206/5795_1 /TAXON_ID=29199 /ORGANISM="Chlorarachnion reptans, Strain CCCM449" /LENGTH=259 /DNA_ID=CAMNT_0001673761 /DNA_START=245 /DNA_END=1025 /DNA_ORIENTATION=-